MLWLENFYSAWRSSFSKFGDSFLDTLASKILCQYSLVQVGAPESPRSNDCFGQVSGRERKKGGVVRVLIAEDDLEQAAGLAALVSRLRPDWRVYDSAHNRAQLAQALDELVPDLLLLDLHMPADPAHPQTVLEHLNALQAPPVVILITGDPTRALEAYESSVADYVVKPPRPARLAQALEHAERLVFARRASSSVLIQTAPRATAHVYQWLSGFRGRDIVMVDPSDIVLLQAERKYTLAFLPHGHVLLRHGISEVESKIDMNAFMRIHRSTIVQIKFIDFIRRDEMGRLRVHMKGRAESLVVSRSFEHIFKDA